MSRTCAERHLGPPSTRPGDPGTWKSAQICKTPRVDLLVDFVPASRTDDPKGSKPIEKSTVDLLWIFVFTRLQLKSKLKEIHGKSTAKSTAKSAAKSTAKSDARFTAKSTAKANAECAAKFTARI